jgi:hypothetical protein
MRAVCQWVLCTVIGPARRRVRVAALTAPVGWDAGHRRDPSPRLAVLPTPPRASETRHSGAQLAMMRRCPVQQCARLRWSGWRALTAVVMV